jgi:hypothetical protein
MREPRAPTAVLHKGGEEEKSPYSPNFSTQRPALLDGEYTIALLLCDNYLLPYVVEKT